MLEEPVSAPLSVSMKPSFLLKLCHGAPVAWSWRLPSRHRRRRRLRSFRCHFSSCHRRSARRRRCRLRARVVYLPVLHCSRCSGRRHPPSFLCPCIRHSSRSIFRRSARHRCRHLRARVAHLPVFRCSRCSRCRWCPVRAESKAPGGMCPVVPIFPPIACLVLAASRTPPPPLPKTPPYLPFLRRTPLLLKAPPPLARAWLPQVTPPLLPLEINHQIRPFRQKMAPTKING